MERQQIEIFLALAEELHFGRTAERLRLSQARVSQSIRALEAEIGGPLFVRTSRRVELTPLGVQFSQRLAPAYAGVVDALNAATTSARRVHGRVKVGFLGPVAGDLVALAAERFRQRYRGCEAELRATEIADPLHPLRTEDVDLVLTQLPVSEPGMHSDAPLIEEPRVLAIAATHPLAQQASVTLEALSSERIFQPAGTPSRDWLESAQPWQTPAGKPIRRGPAVSTFGEMLSMIAAGHGVCTVAAHNITYHPRPGVSYIPIEQAPPSTFGFVWRTGTETQSSKALVRTVRRTVNEMGGPARVAEAVATGRLPKRSVNT